MDIGAPPPFTSTLILLFFAIAIIFLVGSPCRGDDVTFFEMESDNYYQHNKNNNSLFKSKRLLEAIQPNQEQQDGWGQNGNSRSETENPPDGGGEPLPEPNAKGGKGGGGGGRGGGRSRGWSGGGGYYPSSGSADLPDDSDSDDWGRLRYFILWCVQIVFSLGFFSCMRCLCGE